MWGRKRKDADAERPSEPPQRLRDALRKARVDQAERSGVVVDLHDAEVARLELLNEALDPLFEEVPKEVDLFDRGISRGETPRLWIDAIAHVSMGRDKRMYRLLQETRYGRKVLAESVNVPEIVHAVTKYLAQRLIERERALADGLRPGIRDLKQEMRLERRQRRRRALKAFVFGVLVGVAALIAAARKRAPDRFAAPSAVAAFDAIEIVAAAIVFATRRFGGRRRAHNRDAALRSFDFDERVRVVVAVDDELGPMARQRGAKVGAIEEPFEIARRFADRGMVDQHHAKEPLAAA